MNEEMNERKKERMNEWMNEWKDNVSHNFGLDRIYRDLSRGYMYRDLKLPVQTYKLCHSIDYISLTPRRAGIILYLSMRM